MRRIGIDARKLADFGIGTYLQGLLGEMAHLAPEGGFAVLVSPENRDLLPALPDSWRIVEVDAPGYSLREQVALPLAAMRAGVGVLHVPHYVIPLAFPGRIVVTVHDIIHVLFPEFLPHPLGFSYARWVIRAAVRRARRVVTGSHTTAEDLQRLFGAAPERIQVIPHGVHESFLTPGDADEERGMRARLGVAEPYLFYVGNHKPHKNVEGLLKAYQLLVHEECVETPRLVLAGAFPPDGELAQRARAMGLGARVVCLGHLEQCEIAALFRGALAFVYPTLYEGFGLPVIEAMACGVPVVAGDVPAIREVAGDSALRVNPRELLDLAAMMRRVIEHPEVRAEMRERGLRCAERFRWRRAAEATLAVYREVQEEESPRWRPG